MKQATVLLITVGGLLTIMGLLAAVASLSQPNAEMTRILGLLFMSWGAMGIAIPLYVEARRMQRQHRPNGKRSSSTKRGLSPCGVCGAATAVLWCTTHTLRICPDCLSRHDNASRCLYKALAPRRALAAASRG